MKPIKFKGYNRVFGKHQPDYIPLPLHLSPDNEGIATSCWRFTLVERLRILFGANIYWSQMTFNDPLQPVKPSLDFNTEAHP